MAIYAAAHGCEARRTVRSRAAARRASPREPRSQPRHRNSAGPEVTGRMRGRGARAPQTVWSPRGPPDTLAATVRCLVGDRTASCPRRQARDNGTGRFRPLRPHRRAAPVVGPAGRAGRPSRGAASPTRRGRPGLGPAVRAAGWRRVTTRASRARGGRTARGVAGGPLPPAP